MCALCYCVCACVCLYVYILLRQSLGSKCICICDSVNRQMFLQVGTLTQQPSHSQPTHPPKVPLVHLCTQISLRTRRSPKEKDWGVKVPLSFRLPLAANFIIPVRPFTTKINISRNESTDLWQNIIYIMSWWFYNYVTCWAHLEEFSLIVANHPSSVHGEMQNSLAVWLLPSV